MTPTPSAGDIWEWWPKEPEFFLLLHPNGDPCFRHWHAFNLTLGDVEDIQFSSGNIKKWRKLA